MCKKELFMQILQIVESETEIGGGILQNPKIKTVEVVDARHLLVYFLRTIAGYNIGYIAQNISMTPQGVSYILCNFDNRRKHGGKIFENTFQRIRKHLESN